MKIESNLKYVFGKKEKDKKLSQLNNRINKHDKKLSILKKKREDILSTNTSFENESRLFMINYYIDKEKSTIKDCNEEIKKIENYSVSFWIIIGTDVVVPFVTFITGTMYKGMHPLFFAALILIIGNTMYKIGTDIEEKINSK